MALLKFKLNTNALAQNKEDALSVYPEREKGPLFFYKSGEMIKETVYASVTTANRYAFIEFFGLNTPAGLRGLNLKVSLSTSSDTKRVSVNTNFGTTVTAGLLPQLWPGGPYSFIMALIVLEKEIAKELKNNNLWLEAYLFEGDEKTVPQKRMKWAEIFTNQKIST